MQTFAVITTKKEKENGIVATKKKAKKQILQIYILTKYEHLTILLDINTISILLLLFHKEAASHWVKHPLRKEKEGQELINVYSSLMTPKRAV